MNLTIHKYTLFPGYWEVEMPVSSEILSVGNQDESICLWALVNTEAPMVVRQFFVACTGEDLTENVDHLGNFIGTVLTHNGNFVVHVFATRV